MTIRVLPLCLVLLFLLSACSAPERASSQGTLTCAPGSSFAAEDGCNTCACPESGLRAEAACTEIACIYDPCAGQACGEPCSTCYPEDPDCVEAGVVTTCDPTGQCVAATECSYDPCAGQACGAPCSVCAPEDTNCVSDDVITACNAAGRCVPDTPEICSADLCEDVLCPASEALCNGDSAEPAHAEGICNPQTGACEYPNASKPVDCLAQNMACVDGACIDLCKDVVCVASPSFCSGKETVIHPCGSECNPQTGQCVEVYSPLENCDFGLTCVEGACVDLCQDVVCPTSPSHCSDENTIHHSCGNECNPDTGSCYGEVFTVGDPCDPGHLCSEGECVVDETLCAPMDAIAEGPCAVILGYTWNGTECSGLSGCTCAGPDCDALYGTLEACGAAVSSCTMASEL